MSDPTRPAELDELVALLRSATPGAATLASARDELLDRVVHAPGPGLAARIVYLTMVIAAIALPPIGRTHAAPRKEDARPPIASLSPPAIPMMELSESRDPEPDAPEPIIPVEPRAQPSVARRSRSPVREEPAFALAAHERAASRDVPGKQDRIEQAAGALEHAAPSSPSAPSAAMADALRAYASERYADAAVAMQHVVEGASGDAPDRVEQAEFFLAKCLYHMGLHHASAAAFDEVTQRGDAHPYFAASLRWLAMLAEHLPEPSGVIESVGRYDEAALAELDRPDTREHYHHLVYLLGRARYREGRFAEAVELFDRVPEGTRWGLEARFHGAISHVRERRAQPALAAFRRVIDAVQSGRAGAHPDPNRLHDLAWMSVARLYYSIAMQVPATEDERASELLTLAVAAWRRIPLASEHWLDSFFEETWALYVARQHGRALGHVHALESPYFRDRANPEALVVRAMIFFEHCQWDAVDQAVTSWHQRFDPLYADALVADRMAASNEDAFRILVAVRRARSRLPPRVVPALRAAFADRELLRHVEQVSSITREQERFAGMGEPVLDSSLSGRVASELALARAFALDRTGELARERVHRFAEELGERMSQMDTIELELATARRVELTRPNGRPMGPRDGGRIVAVQGDQIWPFNGEWWRDELPFYVQEVESRCSR